MKWGKHLVSGSESFDLLQMDMKVVVFSCLFFLNAAISKNYEHVLSSYMTFRYVVYNLVCCVKLQAQIYRMEDE